MDAEMSKDIELLGIQRSGTKFLEWLLRENYDVDMPGKGIGRSSDWQWKHGLYKVPEKLGREVDLVVIAKHPISWLPSMWRFAVHRERWPNFSTWLRATSNVDGWNERHRHWLWVQLANHSKVIVRYIDLLVDPERELDRIAVELQLARTHNRIRLPKGEMKPGPATSKRVFRGDYYTHKLYLNYYSDDDLQYASSRIDWGAAAGFGFTKEEVLP